MADPVLHLAGVLGAAVDQPLVLLLRQHIGDLAFQVKVLLAADFQRTVQGVLRGLQGTGGITTTHIHGGQHEALRGKGLGCRQHGGQGFNVQLHLAGGPARLHGGVGQHHAHHLADELHGTHSKHRLVTRKGGQHGVTGYVCGQHYIHYAGHGQRSGRVHAQQFAVRHVGQDGGCMQSAAHLGQVVNVVGTAAHLGHCAFVEVVGSGGAHTASPSSAKLSRLMAVAPWLSSQ